MATTPRHFQKGSFYHIFNRGHRKTTIFAERRDYQRFLEHYFEYSQGKVTTLAYCLMSNHFHFLVRQDENNAITETFSQLCNSHAKYWNTKHQLVGSLFQGRFKAKSITRDEYLLHLSRYLHLNPLELYRPNKKLNPADYDQEAISFLESYPYSSLKFYLGGKIKNCPVKKEFIFTYFSSRPQKRYERFMMEGLIQHDFTLIEPLLLE